ncbi:MACD2-like protein [Mya arenaria]|uniref:MACD2-like protein n=1 Tax=Mya arenaria TaxID=6604 RepID=A0ABY7FC70_MYAAR|nr:MACD2-like protein [Mya arenaria]
MTRSNCLKNSFRVTSGFSVDQIKSLAHLYAEHKEFQGDSSYEGRESLNRKIRPHICDILDLKVDAIVCPTQTDLHLEPYGCYELDCNYVIHTAGPPPDTLLSYLQRKECLKKSYLSCLRKAFPVLGSGGAGMQLVDAVKIAVTSIRQWLEKSRNAKAVDSVVLCMYSEEQWQAYFPELTVAFPYGKDVAGFDQEELPIVPRTALFHPAETIATNIQCYKYQPPARRQVCRHFQALVTECHAGLEDSSLERFRFTAIFQNSCPPTHRVLLHNNVDLSAIEIQVVCHSRKEEDLDDTLCRRIQNLVKCYLLSALENISNFSTFVRCEKSVMGQRGMMYDADFLQDLANRNETQPCVHSCDKDTHLLNPLTMLKYWRWQRRAHRSLNVQVDKRSPQQHDEQGDQSNSCSEINDFSNTEARPSSPYSPAIVRGAPVEIEWVDSGSSGSLKSDADNGMYQAERVHKETVGQDQNNNINNDERGDNSSTSSWSPLGSLMSLFSWKQHHELPTRNIVEHEHHTFQPMDDSLMNSVPRVDETKQKTPCNEHKKSNSQITSNSKMQSEITGTSSGKVFHASVHENKHTSGTKDMHQRSLCAHCSHDKRSHPTNNLIAKSNICVSCQPVNEQAIGACGGRVPISMNNLTPFDPFTNNTYSNNMNINSVSDRDFLRLAKKIGNKQRQLGLELGLPYAEIQVICENNPRDAEMQGFEIIAAWRQRLGGRGTLNDLLDAMSSCGIDTNTVDRELNI